MYSDEGRSLFDLNGFELILLFIYIIINAPMFWIFLTPLFAFYYCRKIKKYLNKMNYDKNDIKFILEETVKFSIICDLIFTACIYKITEIGTSLLDKNSGSYEYWQDTFIFIAKGFTNNLTALSTVIIFRKY